MTYGDFRPDLIWSSAFHHWLRRWIELLHQGADFTPLLVSRQRLIGHHGQQARLGEIGGEPVGRPRFAPEGIEESAPPLVADRDRRREDQGGPSHAQHGFQSDHGLARAGRGDEVKMMVSGMRRKLRQYASLVGSPFVAEPRALRK
jgi:hypothetical protein